LRKFTYLLDCRAKHVCLAGECFACCYQFVADHLEDETIDTGQTIICYVVGLNALTKVNAEATLGAAIDVMFVAVGAGAHQYTR
jgi:hypothetical protein